MLVVNERLSDKDFRAERTAVLGMAPIGRDIDLEEALDYRKAMPASRNVVHVLDEAVRKGESLTEARGGVPIPEEQAQLLKYLHEVGKVDILPASADTYTRTCLFDKAAQGLEESRRTGRSMINGYPFASVPLGETRMGLEGVDAPVLARPEGRDLRLIYEVALAAGFSGGTGNSLTYYGSGCKKDPLDVVLRNHQYIDRLHAYYEEQGVPTYREIHGVNMRILFPPGMFNAYCVLIALLSATQGVKHLGVINQINGNVIQDAAAVGAVMTQTRSYLDRYGFKDVTLYSGINEYGGQYPLDEAQAFAVISYSAIVAAASRATIVITKSPHEAHGIPTMEANAAGARTTKVLLGMARKQDFLDRRELAFEQQMIETETEAIVEKVLDMGDGDLIAGIMRAYSAGVLDVPMTPNVTIADRVMPVRDLHGAVRYLDAGNVPIPRDILSYHADKIAARAAKEGRKAGYDMMIDDLTAGLVEEILV